LLTDNPLDISRGITQIDITIQTPIFPTRLVLANGTTIHPSTTPDHTIPVVHTKHNENCVIDAAGAHFGFRDALTPYGEYVEKTRCRDLGRMEPYDATETKDIDHFLTVPFMVERFRGEVGLERGARVCFKGVVGRGIGRRDFGKD